ncbi:inner membrane-spanning protein YciB [Rhizobium sp. BR 314]|uniref:inner membrane-spanning protein YciB n=1 Tax=Rhizobium sp. BR 314 TaxID=3040013 RepID=UPI0039BF122F
MIAAIRCSMKFNLYRNESQGAVRSFFNAARLLLADLASSLLFVILLSLTHNATLATCLAIALGLLQIGVQFIRGKPIEVMEWLSLILVIAAGVATLLTDDPRFVLFKPSIIYAIVAIVMLKPGWMNRYLPAIVRTVAPDVATYVGFAWAGLMFLSAALNAFIAIAFDLSTWAVVMPAFATGSKVVLMLAGFVAIRLTVTRRMRAMPEAERNALLVSTGERPQSPLSATSATGKL